MLQPKPKTRQQAQGRALCVAPSVAGAEAGALILRQGGNAFDAIVAAGFMEAVVEPQMCGIGGYAATAVGWLAKPGKLVALDANTLSPAAATPTMFPTKPGSEPNAYKMADTSNRAGPLSVGVPGVLAGLAKAVEAWGRLPLAKVMAPAIALAREGALLAPAQALRWVQLRSKADGVPVPEKDERQRPIVMSRLADTLAAIAQDGPSVFYSGRIGKAIADFIQKQGGILTREDMAAYEAKLVEPVTVVVGENQLATAPPASGGLTSLQLVALVDRLERNASAGGAPGSAQAFDLFLETSKVVWEDRLTTLADPAAMKEAPQALLSGEHLAELEAKVRKGLAHPERGRIVAQDPLRGTVHMCAADAEGNLVAWTQTHGGGFGSGVMVPGLEVVLGHGMCRFDPRPGWPNSVGPRKRPLHNMCPVVAVRSGKAVFAAGAAGGRTIVNNVAALTIAALLHDVAPAHALAAARLQCETMEPATLEASAGPEVFEYLRHRGHLVNESKQDPGRAHIIARAGEQWSAAAEPRIAAATVAVAK